jgi:cytochrome c biogenesis protein CcdA
VRIGQEAVLIDIGYAGAVLGGLLSVLSPCSAVLLPGFFAYAFTSASRLTGRTMLLFAGLLTTLVPLGLAASIVGSALNRYRDQIVIALSITIMILGLIQVLGMQMGPPSSRSSGRVRDATVPVSVYLLGLGYGVAGACSGPILGSVLGVAAVRADMLYGGTLLALYAAGMTLPVFLLALVWKRLRLGSRRWLRPRAVRLGVFETTTVNIMSGTLLLIIGVLMLSTGGATALASLLTIDQQFWLEEHIRAWSQQVPDLLVIAGVLCLAAGILVFQSRRVRQRHRSGSRAGPETDRSSMQAIDQVTQKGRSNG